MGKLCKTTRNLFLIPLSYVTILGGICTLIGTSTNLVVHSMIQEAGMKGFSMFELGKVGIFIAIAGIIYLFLSLVNFCRPTVLKLCQMKKKKTIPPFIL